MIIWAGAPWLTTFPSNDIMCPSWPHIWVPNLPTKCIHLISLIIFPTNRIAFTLCQCCMPVHVYLMSYDSCKHMYTVVGTVSWKRAGCLIESIIWYMNIPCCTSFILWHCFRYAFNHVHIHVLIHVSSDMLVLVLYLWIAT